MRRTRAQRRWAKKGITHELIPLKPLYADKPRISYVLGPHESWRAQRSFGRMINMPVRPICKPMIHKGGKP